MVDDTSDTNRARETIARVAAETGIPEGTLVGTQSGALASTPLLGEEDYFRWYQEFIGGPDLTPFNHNFRWEELAAPRDHNPQWWHYVRGSATEDASHAIQQLMNQEGEPSMVDQTLRERESIIVDNSENTITVEAGEAVSPGDPIILGTERDHAPTVRRINGEYAILANEMPVTPGLLVYARPGGGVTTKSTDVKIKVKNQMECPKCKSEREKTWQVAMSEREKATPVWRRTRADRRAARQKLTFAFNMFPLYGRWEGVENTIILDPKRLSAAIRRDGTAAVTRRLDHWTAQVRLQAGQRRDRKQAKYYIEAWGWDPRGAKVPITFHRNKANKYINYKYEEFYPLSNDPKLSGIEVGARVEVKNAITRPRNRIVFRVSGYTRGGKPTHLEASVTCTHTAVGSLDPQDYPEYAKTTEFETPKEVNLTPEDHFVALRSYVAGMAEVGIETMFSTSYVDTHDLPFGFNSLMQEQVLGALNEIGCTEFVEHLQMQRCAEILETAPKEWIRARVGLLDQAYHWSLWTKNQAFLDTLSWEQLEKLGYPRGPVTVVKDFIDVQVSGRETFTFSSPRDDIELGARIQVTINDLFIAEGRVEQKDFKKDYITYRCVLDSAMVLDQSGWEAYAG